METLGQAAVRRGVRTARAKPDAGAARADPADRTATATGSIVPRPTLAPDRRRRSGLVPRGTACYRAPAPLESPALHGPRTRPDRSGEVSEWLKEHAWKVCKRLNRASGVRIPLSPPDIRTKPLILRGFFSFLPGLVCHPVCHSKLAVVGALCAAMCIAKQRKPMTAAPPTAFMRNVPDSSLMHLAYRTLPRPPY